MRTVSAWCSKPVEQCRGEDGIVVEDAGPVLVHAVRGNQRGAAFVAVADDLEQAVGAELVDRQVAELVNAKDLRFDVLAARRVLMLPPACAVAQRVDDVDGAGKQHRLAAQAHGVSQCVMRWLLPSPVPEMNTTLARCLTKSR